MMPIELAREIRDKAQEYQQAGLVDACANEMQRAVELCLKYGMHHEAEQVFYSDTQTHRIYNARMMNRMAA